MSDRVVQSNHDCDEPADQSTSYQSVWMAHWTQTSSIISPQTRSHSSHPCINKEDGHTMKHHISSGVQIASDISRSAKGFKEVEARAFGIMNESLAMSLKSLRNENLGCRPAQTVDLSLNSGSEPNNDKYTSHIQGLRSQFDHKIKYSTKALRTRSSHFPSVLAMASPATDASAGEPEGLSQNPTERANSHIGLANSSFSLSRPLEDDFIGSASHPLPRKFEQGAYNFDSGRTAVTSFMRRQEEIASKEHFSNANMTLFEQHHHNIRSAFMFSEEKIDKCLNYGKSVSPHVRQTKTTLLPNVLHMSNNRSSVLGGEQYQRNRSGKLFPGQSSPPEMTKSEKVHPGHLLLQKMPQSVHDVESLKICTPLDSKEGLTEVPPRFYQTARSFLVTKETDVNLCEENQLFRESRVSTQLEGNTSSGTHNLVPLFGYRPQGVKLQPPGSSTDSEEEEKENVQDAKASEVPENESSAETDTMDMDSLKENPFSGVKSTPSNKVIAVDLKFPSQATVASAREEVADRQLITELPDINAELPALPDGASSMDKAEPSTSRTQSLDMELVVAPSEKPSNSKSIHCPDDPMGPEPCSRWIKRLKLSAPNSFGVGTKSFVGTTSSNLGEASTHKKVNKFFESMKGSISSSKPTLGKHHGKEAVAVDSAKKGGDINLSHAWIQRWRRRHDLPATEQKKPEAVVVCEPQISKLEDFQKQQFPSTAAMALMGKAMTGFQPCEFQKRGSFMVWNTKGF